MSNRCAWCTNDPLYIEYHDTEWGRPLYDERVMFELLCLEGLQAGLSWITVLKKREHYRKAMFNFDAVKMAAMSDEDIQGHLQNADLIRNRLKMKALRSNAVAYLKLCETETSLVTYMWNWVENKPIVNGFETISEVPAATTLSQKISKDLKKRGFTFVGPTIIYAFMQATGMVMDHTTDCWIYKELLKDNKKRR